MKNTYAAKSGPPRRWATLSEMADHLNISVITARRMVARGVVPGYRFGDRAIRVDLNEVDETLVRHAIPNARSGRA